MSLRFLFYRETAVHFKLNKFSIVRDQKKYNHFATVFEFAYEITSIRFKVDKTSESILIFVPILSTDKSA